MRRRARVLLIGLKELKLDELAAKLEQSGPLGS